jgi:regulator of cell morphogenesis and NO signaling
METPEKILRIYELPPRLKHPTIFEWFETLPAGESFTIENDHDPKPLYYQMLAQLGPVFHWEYSEQGPELWKVILQKKNEDETTVGSIVTRDIRKAEVFKKLGIDFCCGGKKTVSQAASEAGLTIEEVQKALHEAENSSSCSVNNFTNWEADFLADYIYNQHHKYFYDRSDDILRLAAKVSESHAQRHPQLVHLVNLVDNLFEELKLHFHKEENVLFPYIKELASCKKTGKQPIDAFAIAGGPIALMEQEHDSAGALLQSIRKITTNYQAPDSACQSFRLLYYQLEELEKDLHLHIHLENNILFPKAVQLEKECR